MHRAKGVKTRRQKNRVEDGGGDKRKKREKWNSEKFKCLRKSLRNHVPKTNLEDRRWRCINQPRED